MFFTFLNVSTVAEMIRNVVVFGFSQKIPNLLTNLHFNPVIVLSMCGQLILSLLIVVSLR